MKILVFAKVSDGDINIFDKCAIECALQLSDDVTVISMGPESAKGPLSELTRLGVKVTLICDSVYAGSDTLATSYILSLAAKRFEYDLIICGRQTTDGDTAQVGPQLSARLGIPVIANVLEILSADSEIICKTRDGDEKATFPALITVERINTLRFPRMRSKKVEIEVLTNNELGADVSRCGLDGSPTQVLKVFENKRGIRKCQFIKREELDGLVEKLRHQVNEEMNLEVSETKLKEVWIVGEEVRKDAERIAEKVVFLEKDNPEKIAKLIKIGKPEVVLWNADLWGRKNAPIAAAILEAGLCADCVKLETDGDTLFMYRPAKSGNITAKIICKTRPQMATVRTVSQSSDVIVSAGKGVMKNFDKVREYAQSLNAEFTASRGIVDAMSLPLEMQVGLTGKTVSPKVYIAVGISGAVHHTCAIENAGTIIAINPDKNARIFEYADYGILEEF